MEHQIASFIAVILCLYLGGLVVSKIFDTMIGFWKRQKKLDQLVVAQQHEIQALTQESKQHIKQLEKELELLKEASFNNQLTAEQQIESLYKSAQEAVALADESTKLVFSVKEKMKILLRYAESSDNADQLKSRVLRALQVDIRNMEVHIESWAYEEKRRNELLGLKDVDESKGKELEHGE